MKFKIVSRAFKDKSLENTIIKTIEYFATLNKERAEKIEKKIIKEELHSLLQDLVNYVEIGLKKKFSMNFNVLISETPNYAIKFEKGCLLVLNYLDFVIIVYKTPYICVPNKFNKKILNEEEKANVAKSKKYLKDSLLNEDNYSMINYGYKDLIKLSQDKVTDLIFENIAYCNAEYADDKDYLGCLAQAIQFDLNLINNDYNYGVIIAKKNFYSEAFLATSNLIYHSKMLENSKCLLISNEDEKEFIKDEVNNETANNSINNSTSLKIKAPKLKDMEIFIYHKKAIFESVFQNIVTGKFQNVEFKHIFILISVIIFFIVTGFCSNDESVYQAEKLSFFDDKICRNKSSLLSTIGVLFIMIIVSGVLKKKIDKKKKIS